MDEPGFVGVVDDDESVNRSLCLLIGSFGFQVKGYASGLQFLDDPACASCTCLLLDVRMPGLSGLEVQARLIARGSHVPIIFMTGHGDVDMAVRVMRQGARDFLQKPINDQTLLDKLPRAVELGRLESDRARQLAKVATLLSSLTDREREIIGPLTIGDSNKMIAKQFALSVRTVEEHRAHILKKMEARSIIELALMIASSPEADRRHA